LAFNWLETSFPIFIIYYSPNRDFESFLKQIDSNKNEDYGSTSQDITIRFHWDEYSDLIMNSKSTYFSNVEILIDFLPFENDNFHIFNVENVTIDVLFINGKFEIPKNELNCAINTLSV